jgi:phospholipid/cholesterol/gamma-HCH transport system substrate-binding protein
VTGKLDHAASALDSATIDSTLKNLRTTSANVTALTNNLANTTAHLDDVLAKVDTGGGSAGKLINDPALFNSANMLLTRLDSLTADLKLHPKKYVRLSIF